MIFRIVFSVLFLSGFQFGFGQDMPSRILYEKFNTDTGIWENVKEDIFDYDRQGNILFHLESEWNDSLRKFEATDKHEYEYLNDGRLFDYQRFIKIESNNDWHFKYREKNNYDLNGCLKDSTRIIRNPESPTHFTSDLNEVYFYTENCRPDSSHIYYEDYETGAFFLYGKKIPCYFNDGRIILNKYYRLNEVGDDWLETYKDSTVFDEKNRIVEYYKMGWDSDPYRWFRKVFDSKNRLIFERSEAHGFEQYDVCEDSIIYIENEFGEVIEKEIYKKEYTWWSGRKYKVIERFENYCDGRVKSVYRENLFDQIFERFTYEYEMSSDCLESDENAKITLFPNLAENTLQIQTEDWDLTNVLFRIFDEDGRLFFEQKIDYQTSQLTLDISFLEKGNYVVSFDNGKARIGEKLLIWR